MIMLRFASLSRTLGIALVAAVVLSTPLAAQQHPNHAQGFEPEKLYQLSGIENVNLFNGVLNLAIPVGADYPVGGGFSYGLTLTYSSNVWEYEETCSQQTQECWMGAYPRRRSNAGLGWLLSLGFLSDPLQDLNNHSGAYVYQSPDGADHQFFPTLHVGGTTTSGYEYTRNGSYLRFREAAREIDFPDGTIRKFDTPGRVTEIRDRFGNKVTITYALDGSSWTLTDNHGRQQIVYFRSAVFYGKVVDRVVLKAFNGTSATYTFTYADNTTIARGCDPTPDTVLPVTETVPLLTGINLPDGSSYSMPVSDYNTGTLGVCSTISGHLEGMKLPTGGRMEWAWQTYLFPQDGKSASVYWSGVGLAGRTHRNASGGTMGNWTYQTAQTAQTPVREMVNTVVDPLGHSTTSYFSVYRQEVGVPAPPGGWMDGEYGLPFTRNVSDGTTPGRYLSTEVRAAGGSLKRRTFVRYENGGAAPVNARVASTRTVYVDDGSKHADVDYSDFDGVGNYRSMSTSGNFDAGNARTVYTNYNPGWCATCTPATSAPWVLGTATYQTVTEGGVTAKTESCFEAATGFLLRTRTLESGTTAGANDLVTRYSKDTSGNVTAEEQFGGDTQSVGTGSLCSLALSGPKYRVDHTYQYGTLRTSTPFGMTFKTVDRDLDYNTGLVKTGRDSALLATSYEYDALGRLTYVKPAQDGWTQYVYGSASGTTPAKVWIYRKPNGGGTALASEEVHFDPLGRVAVERRTMADGTTSDRKTYYDGAGNVTSKTEWGTTASTSYLGYDPFGRPGTIRPPDGSVHDVTLSYQGVRQVSRAVKVGTGWNGSAVTETSATTVETYDRQGRLYQVFEPANPNGTNSTTTYAYDVGGRLRQVTQTAHNSSGSPVTQTRLFTYDNRGFLSSERHPEKGSSGDGSVYYYDYDAGGNPGRILDGPSDLTFTYDGAGRVTRIRESGSGFTGCATSWSSGPRCLKELTYGTSNGAGDSRLGKLQVSKRYNYPVLGTTTYTGIVNQTYTYGGKQGRVSARETSLTFGGTTTERFNATWTWNDLGEMASVGYPQCSFAQCTAPQPRTVSSTYTNGFLTALPGYATSISYHPNGQVNQVTRGNGVIDTYFKDPQNQARPNKIDAKYGSTVLWLSGVYAYDGAGNMTKQGNAYFLYDRASRIDSGVLYLGAGAGGTAVTFDHAYDGFGNLASLTANGVVRNTPTAATTNRLTGSISYDAAGNLTSWNGNAYQYDRFHQMTRMAAGSEIWLYMYDADDERVWSFKEGANPRFDRWTLRDLDGKVLRTYEATNYVWSWSEDHVYRGSTALAAVKSTGITHLHTDHLGTIRAHTNSSGARTSYHVYYPFGEEATGVGQNTQRMKFTGHERDLGNATSAADDLDYMHARFYNPQVGRFLSTDPVDSAKLTVPQSWNYYAYAIGNPLRYTDPTGESLWDSVKGFGNAVASNLSLGLYARVESNNPDFQAGQRLGDQAALVAGLYEASQGTGAVAAAAVCTAGSAGGCTPAAAPAAAAGVVAIVHGSAVAAMAGQNLASAMESSGPTSSGPNGEVTPTTDKSAFESVKGNPAKRNKETGEIWVRDRLHKNHYEVYKDKKDWEKGKRDRSVWDDGRVKERY